MKAIIRPLTDAEIIATAKAQGLGVVDKEEPRNVWEIIPEAIEEKPEPLGTPV